MWLCSLTTRSAISPDYLSSAIFQLPNTGRSLDGVTMNFSREDAIPTSTSDLLQS